METEEARKKARELNLDLVEIAEKADPPVVRIINFKKFKYQEAKKERVAKRKTKEIETKEIWLGPLISDHDLLVRAEQARNFLAAGDRVKLTVKFAGREITHPEFGHQVLEKFSAKLSDVAEKDSEARLIGKNLILSLKPAKGSRKENETKNEKSNSKEI